MATISDQAPRSTIWQELDSWSRSLEIWQRLIIADAVRYGRLTDEQIEQVYRLFLWANDIGPKPKETPEIPRSVTGRAENVAPSVMLTDMANLHSVNALPDSAALTFGGKLTIVYGGNGTGKSGFVRVLANACFSRARPDILPNVHAEGDEGGPTCDITVKDGSNKPRTVPFHKGTEDTDLRRFTVFDTSVARSHLAEENPLGFTPVGFDVFAEMIRVYQAIEQHLNMDIQAHSRVNSFTKSFLEPTSPISETVAVLGASTDIGELKQQAVFGEKELARLATIEQQLTELKAKSAEQTLKDLEEAKAGLTALRDRLRAALAALQPEAKALYQTQLDEFAKKTQLAVVASIESFETPFFQSVGTDEWQAFVVAARALAHVEHEEYPRPSDHCLLCHRPLDEPSVTLIQRFWNFLDGDARNIAATANEVLDRSVETLDGIKLDIFDADSRVHGHLTRLDGKLAERIDRIVTTLKADRDATAATLKDGKGTLETKLHDDPVVDMDSVLARIEDQTEALKKTDQDALLKSLEAERVTLRHRQVLSRLIDDIEAFVRDQKWIKKARGVISSALNTTAITTKENNLFGTIIEGSYSEQFNTECIDFDCVLPLELLTHGRVGKTQRRLTVKGGYKPIDILSEGEQRAVALADFLTEVNLNPASAGIILDDPVTSQDHERKELIAKRLVAESKTRQTIIFTHDLVFLTMLIELAEKTGVSLAKHWVERDAEGRPGQVKLDDSPANTAEYKTTKKANATLIEAKGLSGRARVQAIERGMGELRRTIEEAVIRNLFKGVVQRWDEQVSVGKLKTINWSNDLVDDIDAVYDDLSRYIDAHSHSEPYTGAPPEPKHLAQMIDRVDALIKRAKADRIKAA